MKADFPSEMLSAVYGLQMEARWAQPDMNGPGTDHQEPGFFFLPPLPNKCTWEHIVS